VAASAFATAAGSPDASMKAIAGRALEHDEQLAPACSAARRVSVFLTMRNRAPSGMSLVAQRLELLVRQSAVVGDE